MLGIRTKLSLVFFGLLLIIVVVGIQSIFLFNELGGSIDLILRENYRSVVACHDMKESLERVDSGLLQTMLGRVDEGKTIVTKNLNIFDQALKVELQNLTLPDEEEKVFQIKRLFEDYKHLTDLVMDPYPDLEKRRDVYFAKMMPLFREIKGVASEILQMNQANMNVSDENARSKAREARRAMIVLILVALTLAVGFMFLVSRWILRPIFSLINAANEIKSGNLDVVIHSKSGDEIGELAHSLDAMAASLRELKRSDQAHLNRIRRSTEQAFNIIPDGIAIVDELGNIELANRSASDLFDLRVNQRISGVPLQLLAQMYYQALNAKSTGEVEKRTGLIQRFVEGEERFFLPRAIPITDSSKYPTGVLILLSDVTQEHHQNELKKSVVATAAHQLRTPLTSVRMALHLLLEEKIGPLSDKQVELTIAAKDDSERLYLIIEQLLSIGRIESGKTQLDKKIVQSHQLIFDSVEPFQKKALEKGITLKVDLPVDLPAVEADPFLASQVFANLLSNALKYTDPGGSVTISAVSDEGYVRFSVTDTGKGIPRQYLNKILDQFFRVPGQVSGAGVGLGLPIVQEIITAHGGTLDIESAEGRGSAFTVSFKRADIPVERMS